MPTMLDSLFSASHCACSMVAPFSKDVEVDDEVAQNYAGLVQVVTHQMQPSCSGCPAHVAIPTFLA